MNTFEFYTFQFKQLKSIKHLDTFRNSISREARVGTKLKMKGSSHTYIQDSQFLQTPTFEAYHKALPPNVCE